MAKKGSKRGVNLNVLVKMVKKTGKKHLFFSIKSVIFSDFWVKMTVFLKSVSCPFHKRKGTKRAYFYKKLTKLLKNDKK